MADAQEGFCVVTAEEIKRLAGELGADLIGIAPVARFAEAPAGFHPTDVLKGTKAVVVVAVRFPAGTLAAATNAPYTMMRNQLMAKMDDLTFALSVALEQRGVTAVPIPSSDPYDYWDVAERRGQGVLSLKHAAVRAGLGRMGKNTLLVNDKFGNMLWLGAVLVDAELAGDDEADYEVCPADCRLCIENCPGQAMDGVTVVQKLCRPHCGRSSDGGGFVYACNICRKICPNCMGL